MILISLQRPSTWLHVSSANTDLYADVTPLTCSMKLMDMHHLQTSLNAAVSETVHWATANKLPLNEKTRCLGAFPWDALVYELLSKVRMSDKIEQSQQTSMISQEDWANKFWYNFDITSSKKSLNRK